MSSCDEEKAAIGVIDDDPAVRDALSMLIETMGFEARCYASADEFLACRGRSEIRCLVLDIRMPGTNGITLQEILTGEGSLIPHVFITGHADVSLREMALKGGAIDFLEKPYSPAELKDAIRRGLEAGQKNKK